MWAALALAVLACAPAAARAGNMRILVPAYFNPGAGGTEGQTDGWAQLTESAGKVGVTAIFNPNDGPDSSAYPENAAAVSAFRRAGGKVVAYVYTGWGGMPIGVVESQIQAYLDQYPGLVDGFFVDAMSNHPADLSYYQALYQFITARGASFQVIGNPGAPTTESYLGAGAADTLLTYEQSAAFYAAATPPGWVRGYSAAAFGAIVHAEPAVFGMVKDVALAEGRRVGYLYVTDETMDPLSGSLYTRLPSYWNEEVAAVGAAAPEPGTMVLIASGLLAVAGTMRFGLLSQKRRFDRAAARAFEQPAALAPQRVAAFRQTRRN